MRGGAHTTGGEKAKEEGKNETSCCVKHEDRLFVFGSKD
jgi:hypothetical protein